MLSNQQRLFESFDNSTGVWRLRTLPLLNSFSIPPTAKHITLSETSNTDVWRFFTDQTELDLLKTITITYTAANKKTIQSIGVAP